MYVWRLPLFSFAVLASTAITVCVLGTVLVLRGRIRAPVVRGILSAAAVLAVLTALILVDVFTRRPLAEAARQGMYIHPPFLLFWGSAAAAICLVVLARLLFPAGATAGSALRYRACFAALVLLFAILNCANWCSPGWCERYGFPFSYSWGSDAIMIMNGRNLTAGFSKIALLLNVAAAAVASWTLSAFYRRRIT
jgi:hypothetical protein